jgi:glycosyltransferase involved in cell wall biosynthesis
MNTNPIRVLHAASSMGLGGTEKVMQILASNLDKNRFSVATYSPKDGPRARLLRKNDIPTFITPDFLGVLQKFSPHIVHIHRAGWTEPGSLRPLKLAGVPIVVETNVFGRHDPSEEAKLIDCHLFVSRFCLERFKSTTSIRAVYPNYSFLYNPVDTDFFAEKCPVSIERPQFSFGRISRADPGKWSSLALDFLPRMESLLTDKLFSKINYRIIGGIPQAFSYVEQHNISSKVEFLPQILTDDELAGFFNSISFLAHANDTGESFGMVIAEAMAAGLPVITHPSTGLKDNAQLELVDHGETGFVAENSEEYAQAAAFLISNPEKARDMGEKGREKAQRLYNTKVITSRLETIYCDLLRAKRML